MSFSVLMSVYHKENPEYFDRSIASILIEQTLKPDEFVLVCDGPLSKGLDEIIEKYTYQFPSILKTYRLSKNCGLGNALNYGLARCCYEYVVRADSDDINVPERFKKQISFMEQHQWVAVVGSDIEEFNEDPYNLLSYKKMPSSDAGIRKMARFRNPINHMTVAFRKSIIEKVGSYQHLPYLEDYFLWVKVMANGYKIANLNESLVYARVGNGMLQRRSNREYIKGWRTLSKYMMSCRMINSILYVRNMISVFAFVYMPVGLKETVYRKILRSIPVRNKMDFEI